MINWPTTRHYNCCFLSQQQFYQFVLPNPLDVFQGGENANSLPEHAKLNVNHRVAIESSFEEVEQHFSGHVVKVAKKYGLEVEAFGNHVLKGDSKKGKFIIKVHHKAPAAPVSPSNDIIWEYLAGTTRHRFEDVVFTNLTNPIMISPFSFQGPTDSKYYSNLTKHIYRYTPRFPDDFKANIRKSWCGREDTRRFTFTYGRFRLWVYPER